MAKTADRRKVKPADPGAEDFAREVVAEYHKENTGFYDTPEGAIEHAAWAVFLRWEHDNADKVSELAKEARDAGLRAAADRARADRLQTQLDAAKAKITQYEYRLSQLTGEV